MYVYMRLWETVFSDTVINSIEYVEQLPKEIIKRILEIGYTVEEFLDWCIKNR